VGVWPDRSVRASQRGDYHKKIKNTFWDNGIEELSDYIAILCIVK